MARVARNASPSIHDGCSLPMRLQTGNEPFTNAKFCSAQQETYDDSKPLSIARVIEIRIFREIREGGLVQVAQHDRCYIVIPLQDCGDPTHQSNRQSKDETRGGTRAVALVVSPE
jgi:hypothetical protein